MRLFDSRLRRAGKLYKMSRRGYTWEAERRTINGGRGRQDREAKVSR